MNDKLPRLRLKLDDEARNVQKALMAEQEAIRQDRNAMIKAVFDQYEPPLAAVVHRWNTYLVARKNEQ